ncbi:hypothetical protein ACJRO7_017848 [Eucalyptus globulus]|uniref:Uncharacterized protein n=1 Tax=Eucalyptus globulus TaxID=34317 RepID=A0ABD3KRR2_EUCGL
MGRRRSSKGRRWASRIEDRRCWSLRAAGLHGVEDWRLTEQEDTRKQLDVGCVEKGLHEEAAGLSGGMKQMMVDFAGRRGGRWLLRCCGTRGEESTLGASAAEG